MQAKEGAPVGGGGTSGSAAGGGGSGGIAGGGGSGGIAELFSRSLYIVILKKAQQAILYDGHSPSSTFPLPFHAPPPPTHHGCSLAYSIHHLRPGDRGVYDRCTSLWIHSLLGRPPPPPSTN